MTHTNNSSPFNPLYRGENRIPNSLSLSLPSFFYNISLFVFGFSPPYPASPETESASVTYFPFLGKICIVKLRVFPTYFLFFSIRSFFDKFNFYLIFNCNFIIYLIIIFRKCFEDIPFLSIR